MAGIKGTKWVKVAKDKAHATVEKACDKVKTAAYWIRDNKELVVIAAPFVGAACKGAYNIGKGLHRNHKLAVAKDLKEKYVWDPELGCYWHLKRPLKSKEWLELNRRHLNGESRGEILNNMRVLK